MNSELNVDNFRVLEVKALMIDIKLCKKKKSAECYKHHILY